MKPLEPIHDATISGYHERRAPFIGHHIKVVGEHKLPAFLYTISPAVMTIDI